MREIKFRYTVKKPNGHIFSETFPLRDIERGYYKSWIKNNSVGAGCEIIKDQYTGLKDKNGKEIYEGDLMAHPAFAKVTILGVSYSYGYFSMGGWDCVRTNFSNGEIIGNIHQPEGE
jgi:hypothetical protein